MLDSVVLVACLCLKPSSFLNEGVCLNHRRGKFWGEVSLFCSGSSPGHAAGTQRMSSAPSLQMVSLPTAHLFYIASLCSLESGPLWVGQSNSCRRLKVTDKKSKGQNGPMWGESGFKGEKYLFGLQASKIEFTAWEMFSSSASAFQLQSKKSHQLSLSPQEQERNKTLFKGCALIELSCVRAFTSEMISVALSLCVL